MKMVKTFTESTTRWRRLLKDRNVRWLYAGQIISQVGDGVTKVALLWFVYNTTESALKIMLSNGIGDGTAGNEYLDFNIPNLFYDFKTPPVPGPKGLSVDLNWSAHYAPGSDLAASATLKAMRTTA